MKYSFLLVCLLVFLQFSSVAQENKIVENGKTYILHLVKKGETIYSLSKVYEVEQRDLLNANPDLIFGLKTGQELKIPVGDVKKELAEQKPIEQERVPKFYSYKVKRKNTLHYISRRYNVSIEDIIKYNPQVRRGLKKGMVLLIPDAAELAEIKNEQEHQKERDRELVHHLVGDETLYSLSKKYDRSISSILELNPDLQDGLKAGLEIRIPKEKASVEQREEIVQTDGFFLHLVETGETFWQLERRYGTSRDELERYNPVLRRGLNAGLKIKIPVEHIPAVQTAQLDETQFDRHLVKPKETLYSLATLYQTKISELKKHNPVLQYRGLMAGETIYIPKDFVDTELLVHEKPENANLIQSKGCRPNEDAFYKNYQVALMLPLYLEANDTVNHVPVSYSEIRKDTLLQARFPEAYEMERDTFEVREEKIIYPRSSNFMHFYEGVLLAVDSLQRAGMNIELHVFDTNKDQQVIDSLIYLDVFRELDLIVGPVYPNLQKRVADYASKNRIPMVSPLSSGGNFEINNSYYFKVNPTRDLLVRETARFLNEEYFDQNLMVMQMGEYKHLPEADLVNLSREKFFATGFNNQDREVMFREYNFPNEGFWGLTRIASKDRENVFIIPSRTEGQVSVAVSNLNSLAEDYPVTLVGMSNFQNYESIQPEYYHHLKLKLLSPYFVDYQASITNRFIKNFREQFFAEPNRFSFQGYDVAFYFLSALHRYGKDFKDCLPAHKVELTQCDFDFQKQSRFGGYMNHGLFVISYDSDYTIRSKNSSGKSRIMLVGE